MGGITSLLNPLADLVAWVIMHLHAGLGAIFGPDSGAAWGLSIVILVVIIRLLLVPLFIKQVNAQRKMAQHAPQLQELRKKYKNDKQRLNEETMKYYKENGVNPLAGCLPLIPQMIIFFSLFYVLRAIADWKPGVKPSYGLTPAVLESAQRATIFGVHLYDKLLFPHTPTMGLGASIVAAITVVLSATTTFMTVRQSARRGLMQAGTVDPDNPMAQSQKYMQYIVPFFSLTGLYWQYGLVLYWVTTNVWTLGQQFFMFRNWTVEPAQPGGSTAGAPGAVSGTGGGARAAPGARAGSGGARTGTGRPAGGGARPGAGAGRTGRDAAASRAGPPAVPAAANGQDGTERRGLLRLGRPKQAPPPQPEEPVTRVVRQQPVRQARSKRSGKR